MPARRSKGMVLIAVGIPEELNARLAERCERMSLKKADEIRLALRRHLDYPPADVAPALPRNGGESKNYAAYAGPQHPDSLDVPAKAKKPAAGGAKKRKKH